jgi:hypothetical protein
MSEDDRADDAATGPATLPRDVQARWDTLADTVRHLASATDDAEGFQGAWNAMRLVGRNIDDQQSLDALHVPEDAGEHADALRGILVRIPDGWGRWISCDRGWYPLLVELDEQLRALLPNYLIHQVKEKFGGLRYYWEPGEEAHDPSNPGGEAAVDGEATIAERERRIELAQQLVASAEKRAGITCELCGAAGRLHRTPARRYKTLCPACAEREGYVLGTASDS